MTEWDLQPIVKFENYDPDINTNDDSENVITAGFNYFFNDWTRLQFNYILRQEETVDVDNDEIILQLQVKF